MINKLIENYGSDSLVEWYLDVQNRLNDLGLSTEKLWKTAGQELFVSNYPYDISYVVENLKEAEDRYKSFLNRGSIWDNRWNLK